MKTSRSQQRNEFKSTSRRKNTNNFQQQQFQTESSVCQYFQKTRSREEIYRSKLNLLEKKLNEIINGYIRKIQQQKNKLQRQSIKYKQISKKQNDNKIFWKNALLQTQATLQYFMCKLKQFYDTEDKKIYAVYNYQINQLQHQLKRQVQQRNIMIQQLGKLRQNNENSKDKVKQWMRLYLKSEKQIKLIQQKIEKYYRTLQMQISEKKSQMEKDQFKAKQQFLQTQKILQVCLNDQKFQREINKQQILQIFEKICMQKKIDIS